MGAFSGKRSGDSTRQLRRWTWLSVTLSLFATVGATAFAARPANPDEVAAFAAGSASKPECVRAQVSTVNPAWAAVRHPRRSGCPSYNFGDVDVYRYTNGAWQRNGIFSEPTTCPSDQAPAGVVRDLHLCHVPLAFEYVLGIDGWAGAAGRGWGVRHPRTIYNGGVPSGLVKHIVWRRWGASVAFGRGRTYVYRPRGGYYSGLGHIELRADHRGVCGDLPTYRRLRVRVESRPGSDRYGRWFNWSGASNLCA